MITQMILSSKCFITYITRVRPLIGVCAFVYQQIVRLGEVALAKFANELLLRPRCTAGRAHQPPIDGIDAGRYTLREQAGRTAGRKGEGAGRAGRLRGSAKERTARRI